MTYLINVFKVWLIGLYTPIYRLTERKKTRFHVQNCLCGTQGANKGYVLGLLVHGKVAVEFGS